jgi:hypothetical protein
MSDEEMTGTKAAILNTVVVGRALIDTEGTRNVLSSLPAGYDSVSLIL